MHQLFYNNRRFSIPEHLEGRPIRVQFVGKTVHLEPSKEGYDERFIYTPVHFHFEVNMNNFWHLVREEEWTSVNVPATFNDGTETTMSIYVKKTREEELDFLLNKRERIQTLIAARWERSAVLTGIDASLDVLDRRELAKIEKEIGKR